MKIVSYHSQREITRFPFVQFFLGSFKWPTKSLAVSWQPFYKYWQFYQRLLLCKSYLFLISEKNAAPKFSSNVCSSVPPMPCLTLCALLYYIVPDIACILLWMWQCTQLHSSPIGVWKNEHLDYFHLFQIIKECAPGKHLTIVVHILQCEMCIEKCILCMLYSAHLYILRKLSILYSARIQLSILCIHCRKLAHWIKLPYWHGLVRVPYS